MNRCILGEINEQTYILAKSPKVHKGGGSTPPPIGGYYLDGDFSNIFEHVCPDDPKQLAMKNTNSHTWIFQICKMSTFWPFGRFFGVKRHTYYTFWKI